MNGADRVLLARPATGLTRRLACFVYEGVLLFGVLMAAGFAFAVTTQQRHALKGQPALQVFVFLVLGVYFVWFWTHGGQTVAMKTWHLRLMTASGEPVNAWRAIARYLLCWVWFLPALAAVHFSDLHGGMTTTSAVLAGIGVYALTSRFHPLRQFWHDAICGTQLVDTRPERSNGH